MNSCSDNWIWSQRSKHAMRQTFVVSSGKIMLIAGPTKLDVSNTKIIRTSHELIGCTPVLRTHHHSPPPHPRPPLSRCQPPRSPSHAWLLKMNKWEVRNSVRNMLKTLFVLCQPRTKMARAKLAWTKMATDTYVYVYKKSKNEGRKKRRLSIKKTAQQKKNNNKKKIKKEWTSLLWNNNIWVCAAHPNSNWKSKNCKW